MHSKLTAALLLFYDSYRLAWSAHHGSTRHRLAYSRLQIAGGYAAAGSSEMGRPMVRAPEVLQKWRHLRCAVLCQCNELKGSRLHSVCAALRSLSMTCSADMKVPMCHEAFGKTCGGGNPSLGHPRDCAVALSLPAARWLWTPCTCFIKPSRSVIGGMKGYLSTRSGLRGAAAVPLSCDAMAPQSSASMLRSVCVLEGGSTVVAPG